MAQSHILPTKTHWHSDQGLFNGLKCSKKLSQTINNLYFSSKSCSKLNNKPFSSHHISWIPTIPTFCCRLHRGTSLLCEELKSDRPLSFPHAAKQMLGRYQQIYGILYGIHGINGYHYIFSWIRYLWIVFFNHIWDLIISIWYMGYHNFSYMGDVKTRICRMQ